MARGSALLLIPFAALVGCGEAEYRAALERTNDYYAHVEKLDDNLASPVLAPPGGSSSVQVRVPRQFQLIQPPEPQYDADGYEIPLPGGEQRASDMTQPWYLGITLPGVAGAWSVQVRTDVAGESEYRPAYLYLMHNDVLRQQQIAAANGEGMMPEVDPYNLIPVVEETLASAFGVEIPAGDAGNPDEFNVRYVERYPLSGAVRQYHEQKTVTEIRFQPDGYVDAFDIPYRFHLYEFTQNEGEDQVAFLLIAPEAVERAENLPARMDLMLSTMELRSAAPSGGGVIRF